MSERVVDVWQGRLTRRLPSHVFSGSGMPTERIAMHRIKELLRLRYECALSFERIALALKVSKGVVAKYIKAAQVSGIADWPTLSTLDDAEAD